MCHNLLALRHWRSERRNRGGNSQLQPLGEHRTGTDRCRLTPAMYCPLCGAEYRSGFTTCSDCQVTLVPDPPAESSDSASTDTTSFALIWSGGDPRKHAEISEALARRVIPARTLRREDHLFNPTAHAPFEVYVPVDLMTTAREAINEAEPSEDYSKEIPQPDPLET